MQQTLEKNKFLLSATAYATKIGWSVFPVASKGKNPLTKHGLKDATRDMDQIKEWAEKYPTANIAVPTGVENGFFVLDVDVKRDKDGFVTTNGHETLENLTDQYGNLPESIQQISGSGEGHHHLYKYQDGIKNDVDFLPGLDIRGDGGYIVVAPSIHESGNKYEWEVSNRPLEVAISDSPQWLLDMTTKIKLNLNERENKRSSSYWSQIMEGLKEHEGRNNAATSLFGHLLRRYVDPILARELVQLWNEKNDPPMDGKELTTVIESIAAKELSRRQGGTN